MNPFTAVKSPPRMMRPSASTATARTAALGASNGLNDGSIRPSGSNRATNARFDPLIAVNCPPTISLPSGCNASADTGPFAPVPTLNVASTAPFVFKPARKSTADTAPRATKFVNNPPITNRPSGRTANAFTAAFKRGLGLNVASRSPSGVSRVSRTTFVTPLNAVKSPATIRLPSGCVPSASTFPSNPLPIANAASTVPPGESSSKIVSVAAPPRIVAPPDAPESARVTVRFPFGRASLLMPITNVFTNSPSANVSVPFVPK